MDTRDMILICKALSDTNRLEIVQMLSDGEKCGCKILDKFDITQPTLSHHMKILVDCGLVNDRKTLTMDEVIQKTKISNMSIPNTKSIGETEVSTANNLRESVVAEAKTYLEDCYKNYENKISPMLNEELDKLADLETRHKEYYAIFGRHVG